MRLVERPAFKPGICAATLKGPAGSPAERWIDTGLEMPGYDNHVYLCETAVREAARLLGFPTLEAHQSLLEAHETASKALGHLQDRVKALEYLEAAIAAVRPAKARRAPVAAAA